jgi:phosphatidylglycerophosphate synthase
MTKPTFRRAPTSYVLKPMLDRAANAALMPLFQVIARGLVRARIGADAVTLLGFAIGIAAAVAIAMQSTLLGLVLLLTSRLADGLDGPVARLTQPTDRGAYLDITLDFLFYASIPLAFAMAKPPANALPAAVLLAAFLGTASSFLAFAVFAQKRGIASSDYPNKGLYYLGGLTEATETLICFALMCVWPDKFAWWAYGFAALCALTITTRIVGGAQILSRRV